MSNWLILITIILGLLGQGPRALSGPVEPKPFVYHTGRATYYHPGLMEQVARGRGIALNGADGFTTFPDCNYMGLPLWVKVYDPLSQSWGHWSLRRIVDCSQPWDLARHLAEGLVELPYQDAVRYGYVGEGHTAVRWALPGYSLNIR